MNVSSIIFAIVCQIQSSSIARIRRAMANAESSRDLHGTACNCCCKTAYGLAESLEEMDFHRSLGGACLSGDVKRIEKLIAKGANVNAEDSSGYSPLHYAARYGRVHVCLLLLKNGALVNKKIRVGRATSLHRASYAGHEDVVKVLIEAGADVCAQDSDGCTPLHKAVSQGHEGISRMLIITNPKVSEIRNNKGLLAGDY